MNTVKGISKSEQKMLKAIQKAVDAVQDGLIGTQTMSDIAVAVGAECWPLTLTIYNMPVIICKDITMCNPGKGTKDFANSISGSFSYNKKPCSIMLKDGSFGIKRAMYANQLPANVDWAVGGLGLLGLFHPVAEGFSGAYSDVLRKTGHTVIGVKNNMVYLIMCRNMNASEVNKYCRDKLKLEMAVMLDGGHVASINGDESSAKINTSQVQYYLIQAVS